MLKLFYISNSPAVAAIAEGCGVDRIWIDLETLGKEKRQKGLNSVKSRHCVSDIARIKPLLHSAEMLVRVDPWNENSRSQIDDVIAAGAELVMLPMWKTVREVRDFISHVAGRAKTVLLLETKEAVECVDDVLKLDFDEIHIGLNDLHLSYGRSFMFEPLADGTVDFLCEKFRSKGIPFGFGGIARLGCGALPAQKVIMEHYRLGSTRAILSRSFCDASEYTDVSELGEDFKESMHALRKFEARCETMSADELEANREDVRRCVNEIVSAIKSRYDEA